MHDLADVEQSRRSGPASERGCQPPRIARAAVAGERRRGRRGERHCPPSRAVDREVAFGARPLGQRGEPAVGRRSSAPRVELAARGAVECGLQAPGVVGVDVQRRAVDRRRRPRGRAARRRALSARQTPTSADQRPARRTGCVRAPTKRTLSRRSGPTQRRTGSAPLALAGRPLGAREVAVAGLDRDRLLALEVPHLDRPARDLRQRPVATILRRARSSRARSRSCICRSCGTCPCRCPTACRAPTWDPSSSSWRPPRRPRALQRRALRARDLTLHHEVGDERLGLLGLLLRDASA